MCESAVVHESMADHYITASTFTNDAGSEVSTNAQQCTINRFDKEQLIAELSRMDWKALLALESPNQIYESIKCNFTTAYNKCKQQVHKKIRNKNTQCKWINKRSEYMCIKKNELIKIFKKDPSIENKILYNKYRNKTNKYINYIKKSIL